MGEAGNVPAVGRCDVTSAGKMRRNGAGIAVASLRGHDDKDLHRKQSRPRYSVQVSVPVPDPVVA